MCVRVCVCKTRSTWSQNTFGHFQLSLMEKPLISTSKTFVKSNSKGLKIDMFSENGEHKANKSLAKSLCEILYQKLIALIWKRLLAFGISHVYHDKSKCVVSGGGIQSPLHLHPHEQQSKLYYTICHSVTTAPSNTPPCQQGSMSHEH